MTYFISFDVVSFDEIIQYTKFLFDNTVFSFLIIILFKQIKRTPKRIGKNVEKITCFDFYNQPLPPFIEFKNFQQKTIRFKITKCAKSKKSCIVCKIKQIRDPMKVKNSF